MWEGWKLSRKKAGKGEMQQVTVAYKARECGKKIRRASTEARRFARCAYHHLACVNDTHPYAPGRSMPPLPPPNPSDHDPIGLMGFKGEVECSSR